MLRAFVKTVVTHCVPFLAGYLRFSQSVTNFVSFREYISFRHRRDKQVYWPVHRNSEVTHPNRIYVGINSNAGTRPGCYIQGNGGVYIGNYVHFASNIGIISGNHDLYNQKIHVNKEVRIGDYCWIGMGAIILPGVILGPRTIVAAGAIVTKSFPEGYCVIGGNPAKLLKILDKDKFVPTEFNEDFYGYIPKEKFEAFSRKHLRNNIYLFNKENQ